MIINDVNIGKYIVEVTFGYNKLWGEDSGRNLKGEQSGTLIGIFPKLTVQFRKLKKAELLIIAPILDSAVQTVQYFDPVKNATVTMQTYTGDWELTNRNIDVNQPFSCSFIAKKKRST